MKKTSRILAFLICTAMLFSLSSCSLNLGDRALNLAEKILEFIEGPFVPENATEFWNKTKQNLSLAQTYQSNFNYKIDHYRYGSKYEINSDFECYLSDYDEHFSVERSNYKYKETSFETNDFTCEAYYDGKLYRSYLSDKYDQKICSELSFEEFCEIRKGSISNVMDYLDCTSSELSQNEDKSWVASFSGYSNKAIGTLLDNMALNEEMFKADIIDVQVQIRTDDKFNLTNIEIKTVFDLDENSTVEPAFSATAEYFGFNEKRDFVSELNPEEFTQIEDVRILEKIQNDLENIQNAIKGKFIYQISNDLTASGKTDSSKRTDVISYGMENNAFYYEITESATNYSASIKYKNGQETIVQDGETYVENKTEEDAKAYIDDYINSSEYIPQAVTSIEKTGDNVYLIKVAKFDVSIISSSFKNEGYLFESGTEEITVTYEGDNIKKIEYKINLDGYLSESSGNKKMNFIIHGITDFEKIEFTVGSEEA